MVYLGLQRQIHYPYEKEHFPFAHLATAQEGRLLTNIIKNKNVTYPRQGRLRGLVRIQVVFGQALRSPFGRLYTTKRCGFYQTRKQYELPHMQT